MKLKLIVTKEVEKQLKDAIQQQDIVFGDDANLVVYELHHEHQFVVVKDREEYLRLAVEEIIYISAIGSGIFVHTRDGKYQIKDTMYQLEAMLYEKGFLRVHKAYIVHKKDIRRIKAGINMKFVLILSNDEQIEVSRSYYYHFKEEMGF